MGGSSSQPKAVRTSSKQTNTLQPTGQAKPIISGALKTAQQFQQNPPQAPAPVPFDPLQQQAQQQYIQAAQGPIQGLADASVGAQNLLLDPNLLRAESNPYLTSYIDAATRPITENYTNSILPNLRSGEITNTGMYGGSRGQISQGLASQGYERALGDTTAKIAYPAYQQGLENLRMNIAGTPGVMGQALAPGTTLDVVGAQRRGLEEQAQATQYLNQWLPYLVAQDTAGFAAGLPGATRGVSTATQQGMLPPGASPVQAGVGGALTGGLAGAKLGSIIPGVGTGIGGLLGALLGGGAGAFG